MNPEENRDIYALRTRVKGSPRGDFIGRGKTIAELAWTKAAENPAAVAFHEAGRTGVTFAQIVEEAEVLAAAIQGIGIHIGDTISFQLPNWREAVAINLMASMVGLRVNPITPIYRGAELRSILKDAGSKLLFIPQSFRNIDYVAMIDGLRSDLPELRHVMSVRGNGESERSYEWLHATGMRAQRFKRFKVDAQSAKLLLYTSGTTGRAKGVIHTHDSVDCGTMSAVAHWSLGCKDVMLMASPVTHITGYAFGLELAFQSDAKVVLMERWDPKLAVELVDELSITASIGATPFLKELMDEAEHAGRRLPSLRMFACGGASVPPELILRASRVTDGCRAFRVYGATEVPLVTKGFIEPAQRNLAAETDGCVIGYEVKVVDAEGLTLPRGHVGEIRARGPAMLLGYNDPADTEKALDEEGYFRTGDLGVLTDEDAVVVTGRLKDIIIRGGENLSPVEIENALQLHPAIHEAAVVSMPHPRLGEGVAAFISVHDGAELPSLTEIADFLQEVGIAKQKFPERIEYVDDFPRTASGKIRKDQLREALRRPLVIAVDN